MTKKEQFLALISKNFEEAEPRREWLKKHIDAYTVKAEEATERKERDRAAELVAGRLVRQLANLEALTVARCLLAFKEIFAGEVREYSERLRPVTTEQMKRHYTKEYHRGEFGKELFGFRVGTTLDIGPYPKGEYHNRYLDKERLEAEVKRLTEAVEADQAKVLADLMQEAETACIAWDMMVKARADYQENIQKMRELLQVHYDREFHYAFDISVY